MQIIKSFIKLIVFIFPVAVAAQSVTMPESDKASHFLERLEIKQQSNPDLNLSTAKPLTRKLAVKLAQDADSLNKLYPSTTSYSLSAVDQHNLRDLEINNIEWADDTITGVFSKTPWFKTFYKQKANFYEVNEKDFFLAINPVIQQVQSIEEVNGKRNPETVFLNEKGVTLRGMIGKKLGFSSYLTDNQERGPEYFQNLVYASGYPAVPGAGYWQSFKGTGFDYFDNRASIYFNAWKYFDFQFGYDKNFIGDGYRSLFLSDNSAPYLFLKFNTRIWKLDYQTIYMQLVGQHQLGNTLYPQKYGVIHDLRVNATKWLSVGLFENVMFSRADHFDFTYLNPTILLISAQQQDGSADKSTAGLDFKANISHTVQLYGQLLFNEFILDSILHYSHGYWANKQGVQLGAKYIDAFKVKNLDLQFETNIVRPFTYSSHDSVSNYSNYNQPMADPLGANFDEFIGICRYQPINKLNLEGKIIYYRQGLDSAGKNFGSNIFLNYNTRAMDDGFKVGTGMLATCINASFLASYEIKENLFIDLSLQYRKYNVQSNPALNNDSKLVSIGIRMNTFRREYDY
jgi:hypothetical protein